MLLLRRSWLKTIHRVTPKTQVSGGIREGEGGADKAKKTQVRSKRQGKNTIGREGQGRDGLLPEVHGNERRNHKTLFFFFFVLVLFFFPFLLAPVAAESKGASKYTEDDDLELAKV